MGWIYKLKARLSKEETSVGEMVAICPKCHYILLLRTKEQPLFCPMCGERNVKEKTKK